MTAGTDDGGSLYGGLTPGPYAADDGLLQTNQKRMEGLYGHRLPSLLLLQRAGYVVWWVRWPHLLQVGRDRMTPAQFDALAERVRLRRAAA